ncbi:MAG: AAA family ATPase [Pirellulales bacterium]
MADQEHPDPELVTQFRQALADCRKLYREGTEECIQEHAASLGQSPQQFVALMQDLERGLLVKVFVEIAQCDWHWSPAELALAAELFEYVWARRPEGDRLRRALQRVVEQAGTLNWGGLVRPFSQLPPLRERVGDLETVVVRLANVVAKIDGRTCEAETKRLRWIQSELERHLEPLPVDDDAAAAEGRHVAQLDAELGSPAPAKDQPRTTGELDETARARQLDEALAELHSLIGLASIKHDVAELVNFLKVQQERVRLGLAQTPVSLHMVFCGNPGTGKTTVARLLGKMLGGMGILKKGHLIETDRSGLVARYAGQTGPKTHKKIDEALDGVLFIDEAYSLVAERGDDPYGNEAVQALLKRVEDDRHRLVVVLAGYPGRMAELLAANPGLSSRFNRQLDFPDYTAGELGRIFQSMCERNHYVLPGETRMKLLLGFQHLLDRRDESFGNGRLARNIFEASIRRLANRIASIAPLTTELLTRLEAQDIALADVPAEVFGEDQLRSRRLSTECPGCAEQVRFGPHVLARRARCKKCGHEFQLDWGELTA